MNNFKITKTILENINEQNDRINECVDIVNGYTTDEETRVNQELQRQENELRREEQYNNNENRFTEINTEMDHIAINISKFKIQVPEVDDTQRLQRAINSLTYGGTLMIGEDLTVSNYIELIDDVNLIFSKSTNIITTENIATNGNFQGQLFRVNGRKNVHIHNINLDGKEFKCGLVSFFNSKNCSVQFCNIKNSPTSQAIMITDSENIQVAYNNIYRMFHGVQLWNSKNCNVYSNVIDVVTGGIWHAISDNCHYYNNTVSNCEDVGIDMEGGYNCSAYDNTVTRCKNGELAIFKDAVGDMTVGCNNLIFHDNIVKGVANYTKYDGSESACGNGCLYINSINENSKNIVFKNNIFDVTDRYSIFTDELVYQNNSGIKIIDNEFNIYSNSPQFKINGIKNGLVKGNIFNFYVDNTKTGEIKNCENTLISENTFNYIGAKSSNYGVLLYTDRDIKKFKFYHNKFTNCKYPLKVDTYNNTINNSVILKENDLGDYMLENGGLLIVNNRVKLINQKLKIKLDVLNNATIDLKTLPCFSSQDEYFRANVRGQLVICFGWVKRNLYDFSFFKGSLKSYDGSGNNSGLFSTSPYYATFEGSKITFAQNTAYTDSETYLDCIANT